MSYRVGVDIGGTFTDFTVVDSTGTTLQWKEDTTSDDHVRAIELGLDAISRQVGNGANLLNATDLFVHGTTVATNMLIERDGPAIGLLCTEGFRDILYFRDGYKPDRFNHHRPHPDLLVERWLRIGVRERLDRHGNEMTPLDEKGVRVASKRFADAGVEAVAIAFLWSMMNPEHELRAETILRDEFPSACVICSHQVLPELGEWERTSATVLSAYILPRIASYLGKLEQKLAGRGLSRPPLIMQINGGCARIEDILRRPVNIIHSGPAAAPAAAAHYAGLIGEDNLITVDMGGTSFDVSVIRNGLPIMSRTAQVNEQPIGMPAVDVHSIGAGGGSIAWVDSGGALHVGPRSAGARPGPACYGLDGEEPTVTDANVVLGYLAPDAFLSGRRHLRDDLAAAAVRKHIAAPLGLTDVEAAAGIIRVVNANMVRAIRAVSVSRGIDPRQFTLVCAGGAGGLHAVELARDLGVRRVFVPIEAGVLCAFGMTVTDVRHDHVATYHAVSNRIDLATLKLLLRELEARARSQLLEEGFAPEEIVLEHFADARYEGQLHEITVPIPSKNPLTQHDVQVLEATFHNEHEAQYAYSRPHRPVEFLHWRVVAFGRERVTGDEVLAERATVELKPHNFRTAYFKGALTQAAIYNIDELAVGTMVHGPAVISAPTTTVVIHSGDVLVRQASAGLLVEVGAET